MALSGPSVISDWSEGDPIPLGYHSSSKIRKGLAVGGGALFMLMYAMAAIGAGVDSVKCNGCGSPMTLLIPGAGPFIRLGTTSSATADFLLVTDGLAQAGGLVMFATGLAFPRKFLVRNDLDSEAEVHVSMAPMVGGGRSGVGLVGTF